MDTMLFWHGVLVACGVALGLEAALLLGLAVLAQRPPVERLAALLPAAGNVAAFTLARGVRASADEWQRYVAFQFAHYGPAYWPSFNREQAQLLSDAIVGAQRGGIAMLLLSELLLAFGAVCILAWLGRLESLRRAYVGRKHGATAPRAALDAAAEDDGTLEIRVEPLER